jgi:hypothetical protein
VQRHVEHGETKISQRAGHAAADRRVYDFTIDRKYGVEARMPEYRTTGTWLARR